MRRLMLLFMMINLLLGVALGEETSASLSALAPYDLTLPEQARAEITDGRLVLCRDSSRVVATTILRVPDEDPEEALPLLMGYFEPEATSAEPLPSSEGFWIRGSMREEAFGEGKDKITLMVLAEDGSLLILSGYDTAGDDRGLYAFLTELLERVTLKGRRIVPETAAESGVSAE